MNIKLDEFCNTKAIMVNASHLRCPDLLAYVSKIIKDGSFGATFHILTKDPTSLHDIPRLCSFTGFYLVEKYSSDSVDSEGEVFHFIVQKS